MRVLVQRVRSASVSIAGRQVSEIALGLLLLVGVGRGDGSSDIDRVSKKVNTLRIFEDDQGKMNLNIRQAQGQILSIPQFTLYADTRKGNRPGFELSADPETAKRFWQQFNESVKQGGVKVKEGVFGAHMQVALVNDGPVTIWLDSKE